MTSSLSPQPSSLPFAYPKQATVNRVLPKNKIYASSRASNALQRKFVDQVEKIFWRYKLSPGSVNLAETKSVREIEVFDIQLKQRDLHEEVLRAIDRSIRHPIAFQLLYGREIRFAMAHKRSSDASPDKWVVESYFQSDWQPFSEVDLQPLPAVLNLNALYERLIGAHLPLPAREGETLRQHVERLEALQVKQREVQKLESKIAKEKQFNRKVELNRELRGLKVAVDVLATT